MLNIHRISFSIPVLVAVFLSGCTSFSGVGGATEVMLEGQENSGLCDGYTVGEGAEKKVSGAQVTVKLIKAIQSRQIESEVDRFLDCAFVQTPNPATTLSAEKINNQRQFRAHVLTTLLARYGAFNITGRVGRTNNIEFAEYDEIQEDAATLMSHIEIAEVLIRMSATTTGLSRPSDPAIEAVNKTLPDVGKLYRVLAVFQVALDAETPTARRAGSFFRNLIGAAATNNIGQLKTAGGTAIEGLKKVMAVNLFSEAYLKSARDSMKWSSNPDYEPTAADWNDWNVLLKDACDELAITAKSVNHCIP